MTTWRLLEICWCGNDSCNLTRDILQNLSAFKTHLVLQTILSPSQTFPQDQMSPCAFQN